MQVIISHNPLHVDAAAPQCLLWNHQEVVDVLGRYRDTVAICLAGHAHAGGFSRDEHGIPHRVLEAIVECPPGTSAYGVLHVYRDRAEVQGFGGMASSVIFYASSLREGMDPDLLEAQRTHWKRPHGHGLAGSKSEEQRRQAMEDERARAFENQNHTDG